MKIGRKNLMLLVMAAFILFLNMSSVKADLTDGLTSYISMDSDFTDDWNIYDGSGENGASVTASGCKLGGGCVHFDGTNDYVNWGNVPIGVTGETFTISCWFLYDDGLGSGVNYNPMFGRSETPYANPFHLQWFDGNGYYGYIGTGASSHTEVSVAATLPTSWSLFTVVINEVGGTARVIYYLNDTIIYNQTKSQQVADDTSYDFRLGARTDAGSGYMDGWLDECGIWNTTKTTAEIGQLWNSGLGCNPVDNPTGCDSPPATTAPSVSLATNLTTGVWNTDINFNVTGTAYNTTANSWNCTMYINSTVYDSINNTALNNTYIVFNASWAGEQAGYDVNVTCERWDYGLHVVNSTLVSDVFLDSQSGNLTFNKADKLTYWQNFNTTIYYNVTASDPNLFFVNLTFFNLTAGGAIDSEINSTEQSGITGSSYTLGLYQTPLNLNTGAYLAQAVAADDHTANKVSPMTWYFNKADNLIAQDSLKWEGNFKPYPYTYFFISESEDRYKLKITFDNTALVHDLTFSAPNLYYREDSGYKGHFVYFPSLEGAKWIDHEGKNVKDVTVTPLGNNEFYLVIEHYTETDEIELESVGDLNVWYSNVTFYVNLTGINTVTYADNETFAGVNYARNLSYAVNYTCISGSTTNIHKYINNDRNTTTAATCDNAPHVLTEYFQPNAEGYYNISILFNTTNGTSQYYGNTTFYADIYNPTLFNLSINFTGGFVNPTANITGGCYDSVMSNMTFYDSINGQTLFNGTLDNGTTQLNSTSYLFNGLNNVTYNCSDLFGTTSNLTQTNLELRTLYIIDEQDNVGFDTVNNATSVIVYLDDNRTKYDFTDNAANNVTFIATSDVKLRFEIIYSDGTIILRYVDIGLLTDDVRVCANKEGITHYEQILTSYSVKPVVLKSVFSDCVVAADYTRFAYQTAKILKAYTYNNLYYLYTWEDDDITGTQIFLASVDGSIATYINLDSLEFLETAYDLGTVGDGLEVNHRNANEVNIYYYNFMQDNTALHILIERQDTDTVVFNSSSFGDPNEAAIIFNHATLSPTVNESTIFKITATKTNAEGDTQIIKYFNVNGETGSIASGFMFIISLIMFVFGLSMTIAQRTFSYFGIFILIANIALLSFATAAWYITFMQAINVIGLIYIFLIMTGKNTAQIG